MNSAACRKWPAIWRGEMRARSLAVQVDDADVSQLGRARDQGVEQHGGRRAGAVEVDRLAGADAGDGLVGRNDAHPVPVACSGPVRILTTGYRRPPACSRSGQHQSASRHEASMRNRR